MKKRILLSVSLCSLLATAAVAADLPAAKQQSSAQTSGAPGKGQDNKETVAKPYTIAELYKQGAALNGKKVVVRGRAVKVTSGIVGKTWTHIQDGTGEAKGGKNDIISISAARGAEVGGPVTVTGTFALNPDTGKIKLEDATFAK